MSAGQFVFPEGKVDMTEQSILRTLGNAFNTVIGISFVLIWQVAVGWNAAI